jgi:hypothetical protein
VAGHRPAVRTRDQNFAAIPLFAELFPKPPENARLKSVKLPDCRDPAIADVQMCLRLADSIKDEPILISMLIRIAILGMATQPVWEGLIGHKWSQRRLLNLTHTTKVRSNLTGSAVIGFGFSAPSR